MLIMAIIMPVAILREERADREKEIYMVAAALARRLPASFGEILTRRGMADRPVEDQVRALNAVLQPIVEDTSLSHPGVGLGYYSIDLDRVLAVAPDFSPSLLIQVPHTYPYFKSYETGRAELTSDSIGWRGKPVFNLTYPIFEGSRISGHAWASVRMQEIYEHPFVQFGSLLLLGIALAALGVCLAWLVLTHLRKELERFANAAVQGRPSTLGGQLPELKPLLEVLQQREQEWRMVTAGRLAASVVHEIRNPFASIRGFSQLLLSRENDPQKRVHLETIIREVDRVTNLITEFLRFAKPAPPVLQAIPVGELLADLETLVGGRCLQCGVQFSTTVSDPDLKCLCDPNQIKQVLLNLVQNALQAMEGGKNGVISVKARPEGHSVALEVSDNGPGIAPEDQDRVFEPFFSTKPSGTGLGLSICKQLLEQQEGSLALRSKPGAGSTFIVFLPSGAGG